MKDSEQCYWTGDNEMLAIVKCFKKWRHYLKDSKYSVEVITDYNNLQQFLEKKMLSRQEAGWAQELGQFNFYIHYRQGALNLVNESLRRSDYYKESEKWENSFWVLLARSQKNCEVQMNDMCVVEVIEGRNIVISVLIRSQLKTKLTISRTVSLSLSTAEGSDVKTDLEQCFKESSQLSVRSDHLNQQELMCEVSEELAKHMQMSSYRNILNALISHFLVLQSKDV